MAISDYYDLQVWHPFLNSTEQTLKPLSCVVLKDSKKNDADRLVSTAELTDANYGHGAQYLHRITWHQNVEPGATGFCCRPDVVPILAAYDTADGTPTVGELWGPIKNGSKLRKDVGGFRVVSRDVEGVYAGYAVLVLFEPLLTVRGTLVGALADGGEALLKPFKSNAAGTAQHTSSDYQVKVVEDLGLSTELIVETRVRAVWDTGRKKFAVVAAGCS